MKKAVQKQTRNNLPKNMLRPTACWVGYPLEHCNIPIESDLINRNHPDVLDHNVRMIYSG